MHGNANRSPGQLPSVFPGENAEGSGKGRSQGRWPGLLGLCDFGLGHKGCHMVTPLEVENFYGSTYHVARTDD